MRLTVRTRFALLSAALVFLVAASVGLVGYLTLRHSLISRAAHTARIEAARLAGMIDSSGNAEGNSVDITELALTRQFTGPGLRVEIDRPNGAIIQATQAGGHRGVVALPASTRARCLSTGAAEVSAQSPAAQIVCRRVGSGRAPLGTVAVAAPLESALDSLATLRNALLLGVLGGTALAALLSLALARRALRPLKRIALTAETIRSGELARRIGYSGHDELASLAGVLDACFEELEGSIERQRRFGADASHELKTPLAAIRANVELLRGWGALEPAARESALSSLDQASARASRLVADLLHLVRLDRGLPRARTRVSLDALVLQAVHEAASLRPDVGIRVMQLEEATLDGDPVGLHQLLLNLLDNALRASPANAEVSVALAAGESSASITVADSGPGIRDGELDRIFERFYSKPLGTKHGGGAGLGLAIARTIAHEHGGELTARNGGCGGAVFELVLPLAASVGHGKVSVSAGAAARV
jgi:two-component system OmpR family sensor kinase